MRLFRPGPVDGKSDAAERQVPILAPLAPVLAAHKLRTGRGGDDLVFGMAPDHPFDPSSVRRRTLAAWDAENRAARGARRGSG